MQKPFWLVVFLVLLCGSLSVAKGAKQDKQTILVRALAYRAIPHERTTYYTTRGYSSTSCYGSGTDWGYSTTLNVNCQTYTTPPETIPVTVRSIEVFNALESNGMVYTVTCTAHWIGSKCAWLIPGDTFQAEVRGATMWVSGRKGGNMGKPIRTKFRILDLRAKQ